jgi:putative membrane protein
MSRQSLPVNLLALYSAVLIWSVYRPHSLYIWLVEVAPAVVGVLILIFTYPRFKMTDLTYLMIWISVILVAIGGHYAYEKMPLFNWLRDTFDLQRNHYDRFVHFVQGGTMAALSRELLLRTSPLTGGKWLAAITVSIVLALSAVYELVEFAGARIAGKKAEEFLGMQGDIWDSQWDMLLNGLGAVLFLLLLTRVHDRLLTRVEEKEQRKEITL